ncbi:MAG: hypothetical protein OK452_03435 [Thaumarchaeota archaeon]|nr:hypothetical protein [Nitrososphaerota archaeon]
MQGADSVEVRKSDSLVAADWPPYHWLEHPEIQPIVDDFWEAKYDEDDLAIYNRFLEILSLSKSGLNGDEIGRKLHINNVRKYIKGSKKSFLTHLRAEHDRLGSPSPGYKWLPLRLKPRGTPDKDWIQVPTEIRNFGDILSVLSQLEPSEESYQVMGRFGCASRELLQQERTNHFGFVLGTLLGDAGKGLRSERRFPSMKVSLVLSKAKKNSARFGDFASFCVNSALGLRMHRIKDAPASNKRYSKSDCFQWIAPVSPLFAWIFQVMMGLKRGEKTTYDQLRADWILASPVCFRIHFLQGLAESDGWVNPGRDVVIIVASPNEQLLDKLLTDVGVPHSFEKQMVNIVLLKTAEGLKLPIFNESAHTNNYDRLILMSRAKRFPERSPLPRWFLDQIEDILLKCVNYDQACLEIARRTGFKITNLTVKKYAKAGT